MQPSAGIQAAANPGLGEVSQWIRGIQLGSDDAQRRLWERYFPQVLALAQRKLGGVRGMADAEDVAASVLDSLLRGAHAGRFSRMSNRSDLWVLLFTITRQKVVSLKRYNAARKRAAAQRLALDGLAARAPPPEFAAIFEDLLCRLFERLPSDELRRLARLRMEGWSNLEIADQLAVSVRTVERKLRLIQTVWRLQHDD